MSSLYPIISECRPFQTWDSNSVISAYANGLGPNNQHESAIITNKKILYNGSTSVVTRTYDVYIDQWTVIYGLSNIFSILSHFQYHIIVNGAFKNTH